MSNSTCSRVGTRPRLNASTFERVQSQGVQFDVQVQTLHDDQVQFNSIKEFNGIKHERKRNVLQICLNFTCELLYCYRSYPYPTERTSGTLFNYRLLPSPIKPLWLISRSWSQIHNWPDRAKPTDL
jgi:hypothetical protein